MASTACWPRALLLAILTVSGAPLHRMKSSNRINILHRSFTCRSGRAHHPKCKTASSRTRSSAIGSTAEVVGAMASTVALHELGHFLAAYLQGIKVKEFSVGVGPKVFSVPVPLRALGLQGEQRTELSENGQVSTNRTQKEVVDFSVRLLPLGGYVQMPSRNDSKDPNLAFNRPWPQQLAVISGGVFANILSAWSAILIAVALVGVPSPVAGPGISVTAVEKNSPAEAYGFKIGDVITRIGDQAVPSDVREAFPVARQLKDPSRGRLDIQLTRKSPGKKVEKKVSVPVYTPVSGMRLAPGVIGSKGVRVATTQEAISKTNSEFIRLLGFVGGQFQSAVRTPQSARLAGPVSIAQAGTGVVDEGGTYGLLLFSALLNLNLAILNALPIPGLDGGQAVLLMVETAAGRRVNKGVVNGVTLAFQIGLV
ncbi:hypothetical protein AAMO2058_000996700 [Amorphochlora amoebiformis]